MSIDAKIASRIAHLARIKIPAEEETQVAGELSKILDWVAQLDEVKADGIAPLSNVNEEKGSGSLRRRPDIVNDGGKPEDILANAPAKTADFFTVPKVVE